MNYEYSPKGGIWLRWKHNLVTIQVVQKTEYFIHGLVSSKNARFSSFFTSMYEMHIVDSRRHIWRELTLLSPLITRNWLVMGDFNSYSHSLMIEKMKIQQLM